MQNDISHSDIFYQLSMTIFLSVYCFSIFLKLWWSHIFIPVVLPLKSSLCMLIPTTHGSYTSEKGKGVRLARSQIPFGRTTFPPPLFLCLSTGKFNTPLFGGEYFFVLFCFVYNFRTLHGPVSVLITLWGVSIGCCPLSIQNINL